MYPRAFAYVRPRSTEEAVAQLAEHGDGANVLAGGMSLVPMLKYRQRAPGVLVDIGRLTDLAGVDATGDTVEIGATTRHADVAALASGAGVTPMLAELAGRIGDVQVRNMGTVGGGLAAVEPTGDWGAALLALRGEVVAVASGGERRIAADDLFVATYTTSLRPDELLTRVLLPQGGRLGAAQAKFERRTAAGVLSCVAAVCLGDGDDVIEAGVGCIGLEGHPVRLTEVEDVLRGQPFGSELVAAAAAAVGADDFRRSVLGSLVRDALERAGAQASAGTGAKR
ncbi:MAG: xanthine dehydrogenase family protein subunit M [Streptosporangiales bacterium]|nr:xanthine dehydrogenase family protein subunit M [Streptosporangiales bacterium]